MFSRDLWLVRVPDGPALQPHKQFLQYHRVKIFKG